MKPTEIKSTFDRLHDLSGIQFPAKVAYKIKLNMSRLEEPAKAYLQAATECILANGGARTETGATISKDAEHYADCIRQMEELANEDTQVDVSTISIEDLDGIDLTLEQMDALMFMIKD